MSCALVLRNCQRVRSVDQRLLRRVIESLLRDDLGCRQFYLAIFLVDARAITTLNERFLQHQGSTDVITFDYSDPGHAGSIAGEIFVCLDEAIAQGRRFRTTWQFELVRYVVHGILHLSGYDDQQPRARRRMKQMENRLLTKLQLRFNLRRLSPQKRRRVVA